MKKYFYLLAMLAVVLGATACSDDDNHPSTNILDKPEVTVPDVKESSAVITWKAIGNATAYIYSLNNGSEQSTDQKYSSTDRFRAGEKLHIQSKSSKNRINLF